MILRMTAHDKQLIPLIKEFVGNMTLCDCHYDENEIVTTARIALDRYKYDTYRRKIANDTAHAEDIYTFKEIVKAKLKYFCFDYPCSNISDEKAKALLKQFEIEIVRTVKNIDENGEVVYVFPRQNIDYNQIIVL